MLSYIFTYLLAAVLLFQGVNLLVEPGSPAKVIPPELKPAPALAGRWGRILVTCGAVLALAALSSHVCPWLAGMLAPLRCLGFAFLAGYGLWAVFGRRIDYRPAAPSKEVHGH